MKSQINKNSNLTYYWVWLQCDSSCLSIHEILQCSRLNKKRPKSNKSDINIKLDKFHRNAVIQYKQGFFYNLEFSLRLLENLVWYQENNINELLVTSYTFINFTKKLLVDFLLCYSGFMDYHLKICPKKASPIMHVTKAKNNLFTLLSGAN